MEEAVANPVFMDIHVTSVVTLWLGIYQHQLDLGTLLVVGIQQALVGLRLKTAKRLIIKQRICTLIG
jgi:hypothetical protein